MARFSTRMRSERISIALVAVRSRATTGLAMTIGVTPAVDSPDAKARATRARADKSILPAVAFRRRSADDVRRRKSFSFCKQNYARVPFI